MAAAGSHSDDAVSRVVGELQRKLGDRVRETSEEMLRRLEEELRLDVTHLIEEIQPTTTSSAEELLEAIRRIDSESTQADILKALVEEARRFASRSAFFLTRAGEVRGWAGGGWNSAASRLEELRFEPPDDGVWTELTRGTVHLDGDGCREVAQRLDVEAGGEGILVPLVLRGRLAGTLFADRHGDDDAADFVSLQLLTHAAAQALETVAVPDRTASPALRSSSLRDAGSVPLWQPEEPPAEAGTPSAETPSAETPSAETPSAEAEAEPGEEAEAIAARAFEPVEEPRPLHEPQLDEPAETRGLDEERTSAFVETPEELAPPEAHEPETFETETFESETFETEVSATPGDVFETEIVEPAAIEEPTGDEGQIWEEDEEPTLIGRHAGAEPAPEPPVDIGDAGQQTVQLDTLPDTEPEAEERRLEPERPAPPAPEPPAPEPAAAPSPFASATPAPSRPETGSTEVRPPDDLEGPGLAFSSKPQAVGVDAGVVPAGDESLHEEARRLARLLVSEIKLYNEEVIEEGRMAGNIYSRLKEDIDRSRQMYDERIDPRIQEDYFYQELVQRLAGGDPKLLGM